LGKVFYAPERLFPEVGKLVSWPVPLVATAVVAVLSVAIITNMVGMSTIVRTQLESNPAVARQLSPEKIDELARQADTPVRRALAYVAAPVSSAVGIVIVAGILLALVIVSGSRAGFAHVLTVCAYAFFLHNVVVLAGSAIALSLMSDYEGVDVSRLMTLSPVIFMDKSGSRALLSLAASIDLLSFWVIFLIALGLTNVAERVSLAKAIVLVLIPWAALVAVKAGWAALF